jgi:integrase
MILKSRGLWAPIGERTRALRERHDIGRAMSRDDERNLLEAVGKSDSAALLPLFMIAMDTGLRASEARALKLKDLELKWSEGAIAAGKVVVPTSKTEAAKGRAIHFTRRVCGVLTLWLSRFPEAGPDIFPRHRVACRGGLLEHHLYEVDFTRSIGSWKRAWKHACLKAGVKYRWHDLRHTFVSRVAETPSVSEETIRALAGHVSKQMLQRYSHIRTHAKPAAIEALGGLSLEPTQKGSSSDGAQNWAQLPLARLN